MFDYIIQLLKYSNLTKTAVLLFKTSTLRPIISRIVLERYIIQIGFYRAFQEEQLIRQ